MDAKDIINAGYSWFLKSLTLDNNGVLEIVIVEAVESEAKEQVEIGGVDFGYLPRIETSPKSKRFKFVFDRVIAFQRFEESYLIGNDQEKFEGRYFRKYLESNYFKFLLKQTCMEVGVNTVNAVHYSIVCENDVIDVVSNREPLIAEVTK